MSYVTETDTLAAYMLTHRMVRQMKLFPKTKPFHTSKECKDRARCVWHERSE